ncbi:gluconate 2-dehydrogenase subunit 3 family protein [Pedobacter antarcticus]|uniref:Transcriptional initiation protein Tat n=2 Tax=Pedobacter antarcticus TaxID=34086 RepID=A0A081PD47_9SPHI|nr:gluconate 2-dehydrogenase subunit 3 family protein [Pedobacter antarcticus]KEQ28620.1 transcriptional initiation protein Tat [Pedobacter antarcticus 4BY]SDL71443.1 Gluconate 2-dehydrogenase subunit 3 [Pedobacter antarcticus]SFE86944.1 Gluconate 2-dehydrogenase subunit 3 [Pedobacter antarcticus]
MNRRESLKAIGLTAISTSVLLAACKTGPDGKEELKDGEVAAQPGRETFEIERDQKLHAEKFFDEHEMATISILADIIIPKDEKSGGALDAKVPDFIEFIVKDIPSHKTPMRGGIKWLDLQCLNLYQNTFKDASKTQQLEMLDAIAYPKKAKPGMEQGVAFFNRMRNLTATGFFTSEIGVKDLGYAGNVPNQWTGVPDDVLRQYGMENV